MAEHRRGLHRQGARAGARDAAGGRGRGWGDTHGAGDRDAQNIQGADQHRREPASQAGAVYLDKDTFQVPPRHGGGRALAGKRLGTGHRLFVRRDGLHEYAVPRLRPRRNGDHRGRRAFAGACGVPGAVAHAAFPHLQGGADAAEREVRVEARHIFYDLLGDPTKNEYAPEGVAAGDGGGAAVRPRAEPARIRRTLPTHRHGDGGVHSPRAGGVPARPG